MAKSKPSKEGAVKKKRSGVMHSANELAPPYDPALALLFASSLGPVASIYPSNSRPTASNTATAPFRSGSPSCEVNGNEDNTLSEASIAQGRDGHAAIKLYDLAHLSDGVADTLSHKRKRRDTEDDLEGRYMQQLLREEAKEDDQRQGTINAKRHKQASFALSEEDDSRRSAKELDSESDEIVTGGKQKSPVGVLPQHESLVKSSKYLDLEQSSRTVFLANVSTQAIKSKAGKKILLDHMASFIPSLPKQTIKHGVESLRFRSTAYAGSGVPKKAAFAKKELMDTTTKSTNAYVVFTTQVAAREAVKRLNGSMVLDRHLRVDSVAHPSKVEHRRCVFVGNLGFVDDESMVNATADEKGKTKARKIKEPADVEEGLWRQFSHAGVVESVRVVRDQTTRVGKGFAYVQFNDVNAVEKALLYNEKRFPPMLPRTLRVTRANLTKKVSSRKEEGRTLKRKADSASIYKPKVPSHIQSLSGRASKLLGRAGAAQFKATEDQQPVPTKKNNGVVKTPERIVFEGYRASRQQGILSSGKRGKPSHRSKKFKQKSGKKG